MPDPSGPVDDAAEKVRWYILDSPQARTKKSRIDVLEALDSLLVSQRQQTERLKAEKGEAEALLGEAGAGGSAAGLVPAIHNLTHRAEQAEAALARCQEQTERLEAERDEFELLAAVNSNDRAEVYERIAEFELESVKAEAALARCEQEGTPGVMHATDRAFYELTVDQRDRAWRTIEALKARLARCEQDKQQLREALEAVEHWASRMPDAGFTIHSARWQWWHERPYELVRAALSPVASPGAEQGEEGV